MRTTQSALLLSMIRDAMKRRGWNTGTLAVEVGWDRARVRAFLSGKQPLLVDEFFEVASALRLSPTDLGIPVPEGVEEPAVAEPPAPPALLAAEAGADDALVIDPEGPQAEQILRVGFAMGVDMRFLADPRLLGTSGVPAAVLERYPDAFPIQLDARFHRHNRARYLPEGLEIRLSFDRVYTCLFPWECFKQISLFPLPPEPEEAPPEPPPGRPVLTLVKS
jgi:hypothetical protein